MRQPNRDRSYTAYLDRGVTAAWHMPSRPRRTKLGHRDLAAAARWPPSRTAWRVSTGTEAWPVCDGRRDRASGSPMWSEEAVLRTDPVRDEGRRRRSGGGRVAGCGAPWFVDNGRGHHQRVSAEPPRFLTQDDDRIVKADSLRAGLSKGRSPTRS